jgi:hypothetical protein
MRSIIVAMLASALFYNCTPAPVAKDDRPEDQQKFISKLKQLDSKVHRADNEVVKDDLLDSCTLAISSFAQDSLDGKFTDWSAEVTDIKNEPMGFDVVKVNYMIYTGAADTSSVKEYESLMFSSLINKIDTAQLSKVKRINKGDNVKISGSFNFKNKSLEMVKYGEGYAGDEVFSNPDISVEILDVKKK